MRTSHPTALALERRASRGLSSPRMARLTFATAGDSEYPSGGKSASESFDPRPAVLTNPLTTRPPRGRPEGEKRLGYAMGGTGLEPVTPSLSSWFSDSDNLPISPTFPAQETLLQRSRTALPEARTTVCASIVRRKDRLDSDANAQACAHTLDWPHRLFEVEKPG